jgi:hypothetical protein
LAAVGIVIARETMRASREPMTVLQLKRSMDARFRSVDRHFDRLEKSLRSEMRESEERLERHFSAVVESIHDDMRMGDHESRLRRLEQRRPT